MVPEPVAAVILLLPITKKYEEMHEAKNERIKSDENIVDPKVFYMKQIIG